MTSKQSWMKKFCLVSSEGVLHGESVSSYRNATFFEGMVFVNMHNKEIIMHFSCFDIHFCTMVYVK